MSKAPTEYYLVREERLSEIKEASRSLSRAIVNYAKGDAAKTLLIGANLSTRCPRCDIRLNGDEFLSLPQSGTEKAPKVQRVELGYCARSGCDSSVCEVNYHRHPEVDWAALFSELEKCKGNTEEFLAITNAEKRVVDRKKFLDRLRRVGISAAVICLLLIVWQWRRGGRIPLLREPEKFRVTILPQGEKEKEPNFR